MNTPLSQPKGSTAEEVNKQTLARIFSAKTSDVVYLNSGISINSFKLLYDKVSQKCFSRGTATGIPTSWTVDANNVLNLVTSTGTFTCKLATLPSSIVGLNQGGTVQDGIKYITPQMFGAKGDFNETSKTGTDDTQAFILAIAAAIAAGYQEVYVPAGNYLITDELNLGGVGYSGNMGVRLNGADWISTILYFKTTVQNKPCVSSVGASGIHTSKGLSNITIKAHPDTVGNGYALQLKGTCFFMCENFLFMNCAVGIHLYNASSSGIFTEFNKFRFGRIHYNRIANILFEVNGGDNSFHGNDFIGIQNQVYSTAAGVKTLGTTSPCYLYNQNWQMNFFGGTNCYAFDLTNCNTDNLWGNLTHESALICRTNDASSVFEFKGNFSGIGTVTFDIQTNPTNRVGSFIFNNVFSTTGNFTNTNMSSYSPATYNPDLADTTDNGVGAAIFRVNGGGGYGIGFNIQAASSGYWFTASNGTNLQNIGPRYLLSTDGNSFKAFTTDFYINPQDSNYGILLSSSAKTLAPRTTNTISLGTTTFRYSEVRSNSWDITSNIIPTTTGVSNIGSSSNYPQNIYSQNAVIVVSDETYKSEIQNLPDEVLDAWGEVEFKMWKMRSAIQKKGAEQARWHVGYIAQKIKDIFEEHGLDWTRYGLITYESWDAQDEVLNDEGVIIQEAKEAGEIYMLRMDECLAIEMAYQRRRMDRIEEILNSK